MTEVFYILSLMTNLITRRLCGALRHQGKICHLCERRRGGERESVNNGERERERVDNGERECGKGYGRMN